MKDIGRLIASKDNPGPFYWDGKKYVSMDGVLEFDEIRSNGDYHIMPTYIQRTQIIPKTMSRIEELQSEEKTIQEGITELERQISVAQSEVKFSLKRLKLVKEQIAYIEDQQPKPNAD